MLGLVIPPVEVLKLADVRTGEHLMTELHQTLVSPFKRPDFMGYDLHTGWIQKSGSVPALTTLGEVFLHERPLFAVDNPATVFPLEALQSWIRIEGHGIYFLRNILRYLASLAFVICTARVFLYILPLYFV